MSETNKQCQFGESQHWWKCKDRNGKCERHEPCKTYMDKYDNDMELWKDLHGEEDD